MQCRLCRTKYIYSLNRTRGALAVNKTILAHAWELNAHCSLDRVLIGKLCTHCGLCSLRTFDSMSEPTLSHSRQFMCLLVQLLWRPSKTLPTFTVGRNHDSPARQCSCVHKHFLAPVLGFTLIAPFAKRFLFQPPDASVRYHAFFFLFPHITVFIVR
jgi:hypothetical protein